LGVLLFLRRVGVLLFASLLIGMMAGPASAFTFARTLKPGDTGPDVKALQIRVAGWYPQTGQEEMGVDGTYGPGTVAAVKEFQGFYGLNPDGIAGPTTFAVIAGLEDDDGSTAHFEWNEFWQNTNSSCSAKANAYSGSFKGGMVSPARAKKNIKRVMWRLEALRAKAGNRSIAINSGFRSSPYNDCIGGAGASQHMYGTAADNRMVGMTNRQERDLARRTQFYGIGCYSSLSHNHFDIRIENKDLATSQSWWWPVQDSEGHDLADDNKPCWGETTDTKTVGSAMLLPSDRLLGDFAATPEWYQGQGD
jgi:peptidoglycan hydrolase-like protein with peptidoglycan-binding domain